MIIKEYFQLLFPFLLITSLIFCFFSWTNYLPSKRNIHKFVIIFFSALLTFIPFTELTLAEYVLSLNPNYSIGSLMLVIALWWPQWHAKPLLSSRHMRDFCLWNVVVSIVLYLSSLGFIAYDIYALGYNFSILFLVTALITITLIWYSNPLSCIFIAYIAAFNLKLLPSYNFFDYMIDGFLFALSLGMILYFTIKDKAIRSMGPKGA